MADGNITVTPQDLRGDEAKEQALWAERGRVQVESLSDALRKVLDTREREAKAYFAYQTASDNYTGGSARESREHLAAMTAASNAEKEARLLLATLTPPNVELSGRTRSAWTQG